MRVIKFLSLFTLLLSFGCQEYQLEENEIIYPDADQAKRMAFNQDVYFLNSTKISEIYKVDFDFQGLQGDAILSKLNLTMDDQPFELPKGGHMCVSPDNKYLTVVVAKESKIFLVDIETKEVRSSLLLGYKYDQLNTDIATVKKNPEAYYMKNVGGITQVDVDQEGFLFIAGKSGFFRVVADRGNGKQDPSNVNYGKDIWKEIWERGDPSLQNGENWVHALEYKFEAGLDVESTEDGEEYFEDVTPFNPKKVKFQGGDILFTQNSAETDGFEQQRLISFSQWKGGTAIYLDLHWDYKNNKIGFDAGKVFGDLNKPMASEKEQRKAEGKNTKGLGKVTGAALTGDNMVLTSHHFSEYFQLRTLDGEIVRKEGIRMILEETNEPLEHNWGDMASTQYFDKNSFNSASQDSEDSSREIKGDYYEYWFRGEQNNHQYGEVKLYRPGMKVEQYDLLDLSDDNYNVSRESRRNSANADIADYNKNGSKFVSLGGGVILMRFPKPVSINSETTLQVVETSWNKKATYNTIEEAFKAYGEKAEVSILLGNTSRYFSEQLLQENWTVVGDASIANNEFELGAYSGEFTWVKIEDNNSKTPDGFDLNFVSVFDYTNSAQ